MPDVRNMEKRCWGCRGGGVEVGRVQRKVSEVNVYLCWPHLSACGGLPRWLSCKDPPALAGDVGLIPGSGRSPGGGNSNPLQYSSLENPVDRGAWRAMVHSVAQSWTPLSDWARTHSAGSTSTIRDRPAPPAARVRVLATGPARKLLS